MAFQQRKFLSLSSFAYIICAQKTRPNQAVKKKNKLIFFSGNIFVVKILI